METRSPTDHSVIESLLAFDARWSQRLRMAQSEKVWFQLAAFLAHSGDSWFWGIGALIIWLSTQGEWRAKAALIAAGIVGLAVVVMVIKFTVRRRRPPGEWGAIYRNTDPHSFPSGHAARAAMLAVMAIGLGPAWFGWIVAIWAPLVSLARVATGMHYLSDVLAGIIIGLVAGLFMLAITPFLMVWFSFMF